MARDRNDSVMGRASSETTIPRMTRNLPDPGTPPVGERPILVDEEFTREVIGGFYTVYNTLGYGFCESVYSRALRIELRICGLKVEREVSTNVFYRGHQVGHFRIDQLVEDRLAIEIKATRLPSPDDRRQLLNGLRSTKLELGLVLHFGPRPAFFRVISQNDRN